MDYIQLKEILNEMYRNKNYNECVDRCDSYILDVEQAIDSMDKNYFLWNCYTLKARSFYKLKQYHEAIKCLKIVINYPKYNIDTYSNINTYWLLAMNYVYLDESKAIDYYNLCLEYFKENNQEESALCIIGNIALINKNVEQILYVIERYKDFPERFKEASYDLKYEELFDIYLERNEINKAWDILKSINSIKMKAELMKKFNEI